MSEASELLETLADIVEPPPPEGAPPLLVAANLALVLSILGLLAWRRRARRRAWLDEALGELAAVDHGEPGRARLAIATVLRRVMRHRHGSTVDALHGDAWLRRLDAEFGGDWFTAGEGRAFGDALYAPVPTRGLDTRSLARALAKRLRRLPRVPRHARGRRGRTADAIVS